jgi:hypothetical protein
MREVGTAIAYQITVAAIALSPIAATIKASFTRQVADLCLFTECLRSAQCAPAKHHYDECAERVTKQQEENGKADEDCVEECKIFATKPEAAGHQY